GRSAFWGDTGAAKIHRPPNPAASLPDQKARLILAFESDRHRFAKLIEQTHTADRRGRQNGAPIGLVVERDVARHDGELERAAGFTDAAHAVDELPHNLRPLRIAEI